MAKKKAKRSSAKKSTRKKACKCPKGWRKAGAKMCKQGKRKMPLACAYPRKKGARRGASARSLSRVLPVPAGEHRGRRWPFLTAAQEQHVMSTLCPRVEVFEGRR